MDQKYTILIADDDHDIVNVLKERLEMEGYQTIEAYEGVRTIEAANKKNPDLILLDIRMPVGTGSSVLDALRARELTKKIPVIVMSALQEIGLEERLIAQGAQAFLKKPFDSNELLKKIHSFLP
ncbi:MAG: response regulator [Deltaproteobacteria bacterium]|nr:response regulator [Deltaproteobacteria bacterium]